MPSQRRGMIRASEITPREVFLKRREFLAAAAGAAASLGGGTLLLGCGADASDHREDRSGRGSKLEGVIAGPQALSTNEKPTGFWEATHYNNFYEFGTDKADPSENAGSLRPKPWSVAIEGEVARPGVVPLETLLAPLPLEERIYRLRCVEAWSMVIPWVGFPLGALLSRQGLTSKARYVVFETLFDPEQMPGQRRPILDWPYTEGLRIDEAMHPLSILAVGMYGETLPNQNGAPLRLVVPWKYGFKSIKSIVKIRLQEDPPQTSWQRMAPSEYGFYANVNPDVDHPRWSQRRERRIGELAKRPTLPFNGYADEVASLYAGMDLRKHF